MRHLAFLLPLLLATSLAAEPPIDVAKKDDTAPSFHIEGIVVEGNRHVSSEIVVAESLLKAGTSYTEDDLREAIYRIKRLPFLLGIDFELRKGSERGRYVLVIAVLETTRFFYAADLRTTSALDSSDLRPYESSTDFSGDFLVGYRYFVGRQGILYLTAGDIGTQLGYSSYNFLNRNVFLDMSLARATFCCQSDPSPDETIRFTRNDTSVVLRLTVGIPRSARQLWRIDAFHRRSDGLLHQTLNGVNLFIDEPDARETQLQVSWIYDTTDDPVFPSRGDELVATARVLRQNGRATSVFSLIDFERFEIDRESSGWSGSASLFGRRYYPIGHRQSLAASFRVLAGHFEHEIDGNVVEIDSDSWNVQASFRHAVDLMGAKRSRPQRRLRWENGVEYTYSEASATGRTTVDSSASFRSELIYRSRWGVFRLGFRLVDILERT